jgi:hypothetical protein
VLPEDIIIATLIINFPLVADKASQHTLMPLFFRGWIKKRTKNKGIRAHVWAQFGLLREN